MSEEGQDGPWPGRPLTEDGGMSWDGESGGADRVEVCDGAGVISAEHSFPSGCVTAGGGNSGPKVSSGQWGLGGLGWWWSSGWVLVGGGKPGFSQVRLRG